MKTTKNIGRILYVPPRGIGDLVFSLPLLHSLHSALPLAAIEISIPKRDSIKQMMDLIGFVGPADAYLPTPSEDPLAEERWKASQAGDNKRKYAAEKAIFEKYLAGKSYDLALVAKPFRISGLDCLQVSRKDLETMGFDWKNAHMVDGFSAFATYIGIPVIQSFNLDIDRAAKVKLSDGSAPGIKSPYVIFNLGASANKRKWNPDYYAKVAKWLIKNNHMPILVGTGDEYQDSQRISDGLEGVLNLVPQADTAIDLRNFAVLAANSSAVISGDTGFLHLADAVGAKVIGLYGTACPRKTGPYNNQHNVISRYDGDKNLQNITPQEVLKGLRGSYNMVSENMPFIPETPKIVVVGATAPTISYERADGIDVGYAIRKFLEGRKGSVFTGGVDGIGSDVYAGVLKYCIAEQTRTGKPVDDRFFVVIPDTVEYFKSYGALADVSINPSVDIKTNPLKNRRGIRNWFASLRSNRQIKPIKDVSPLDYTLPLKDTRVVEKVEPQKPFLLPYEVSSIYELLSVLSSKGRLDVVRSGKNMFERREGLAQIADIFVVLNGGPGTSHEVHEGLKHGKKIITLPYTGGTAGTLADVKEGKIQVAETYDEDDSGYGYRFSAFKPLDFSSFNPDLIEIANSVEEMIGKLEQILSK